MTEIPEDLLRRARERRERGQSDEENQAEMVADMRLHVAGYSTAEIDAIELYARDLQAEEDDEPFTYGNPEHVDRAIKKAQILDALREWVKDRKAAARSFEAEMQPHGNTYPAYTDVRARRVAFDDFERRLAHFLVQHDLLDECEGLPS